MAEGLQGTRVDIAVAGVTLSSGGVFDLIIDGQTVTDEVLAFRAAAPTEYYRGGDSVSISFAVWRDFATLKAAEAFRATHFRSVVKSGVMRLRCGKAAPYTDCYSDGVVLTSCSATYLGPDQLGNHVVSVRYSFRGPPPSSDIPADNPLDADTGAEIEMRAGQIEIINGAESVAVTFSTPLSGSPKAIRCSVARPTAFPAVTAAVDQATVSTTGFTALLSGAAPDGTHVLHYEAVA